MSWKDKLVSLASSYNAKGYRSTEGFRLFSQALTACEEMATRGYYWAHWPEKLIKSKGKPKEFSLDCLPKEYIEVVARLEEEKLQVGINWLEHTSYGSGAYGENEYSDGLRLTINWADKKE